VVIKVLANGPDALELAEDVFVDGFRRPAIISLLERWRSYPAG
jgi:hypothetical protein